MNKLDQLINKIQTNQDIITFQETISIIDEYYQYSPTKFTNGLNDNLILNQAGTNEGSCKIFAFSLLHSLNSEQTLNCFGDYYRVDVLQNPDNDDHANIRTFMKDGTQGIRFLGDALTNK
jgi:hypothetical protein